MNNRLERLTQRYIVKYNLNEVSARKLAEAAIARKNVFAVKASLGVRTPKKQK